MNKPWYETASHIEVVRKRAGMYVGGTGYFGLINYLVCPFNLLLSYNARHIDVSVDDSGISIQSDALCKLELIDGKIIPFEHFSDALGHGFDGPVLTALSKVLQISAVTKDEIWQIEYDQGVRVSFEVQDVNRKIPSVQMQFAPDKNIFSIDRISTAIFDSYFRRISHLYAGVQFRLTVAGKTTEYYSEQGMFDLFQSYSAPYQLLHEPFHIQATEGDLRFETVFAFHSWKENLVIAYVNNGRAVEGGTHEAGLLSGFEQLSRTITSNKISNGIIAVTSIIYPDVVWEGCIKREIRDEKLYTLIENLVITKTLELLKSRPDIASELEQIQLFQFPELWYD